MTETAETTIQELRKQVKRLTEERDELKSECEHLSKKLRSRRAQLDEIREQSGRLDEQYTVLRSDIQDKLYLCRDEIVRSKGMFKPTQGNRSNSPSKTIAVTRDGRLTSTRITLTHLVLIDDGRPPRIPGLVASHLCHEPMCLKAEHLVWETQAINARRTGCNKAGKCKCQQTVSCMIGAHTVLVIDE